MDRFSVPDLSDPLDRFSLSLLDHMRDVLEDYVRNARGDSDLATRLITFQQDIERLREELDFQELRHTLEEFYSYRNEILEQ